MTWLLIIGLLAVVYGAFHVWGSRPARHRVTLGADLLPYLTTLEVGGRDGALLFLDRDGTEQFVQVARTANPSGAQALAISVPLAPWAAPFEADIRAALATGGCSQLNLGVR